MYLGSFFYRNIFQGNDVIRETVQYRTYQVYYALQKSVVGENGPPDRGQTVQMVGYLKRYIKSTTGTEIVSLLVERKYSFTEDELFEAERMREHGRRKKWWGFFMGQ